MNNIIIMNDEGKQVRIINGINKIISISKIRKIILIKKN